MVKEMDIVEKAARAVTYLDMELLGMGDSHSDIVENICFDAGVDFDTESEEYEEDEYYLKKKSIEAYEKLFSEKRGSYEDSICEYYYECSGALISEMKHAKCTDVKEHPTYKALFDFYTYVETLEEEYCTKESKEELRTLLDRVSSMDMELVSIGYQVSSEYWRYLDDKYYIRSNTYYKVGDVVVFEEDDESDLGQYVAHSMMHHGRKYGYSDCGFAIAYKKEQGNIVACLYDQNRKSHEQPYHYKDSQVKVVLDTTDIEGSAKRLAETINKRTVTTYPECNISRYFMIHVNRGKAKESGYCLLYSFLVGSDEEIYFHLKNYGYFVNEEDKDQVSYMEEIGEEEYLALKQNADIKQGYGCMLEKKIFSKKDTFRLKNICFKNGENKESPYGFEFQGQWIVNPFMDVSDRFELKTLDEVYDYYSKDSDEMYDIDAYARLYDFFITMLFKNTVENS